jgi:hypothetical protein
MINDFERIQQSYEKQCEDIMNYIEMIDNLRLVVYKSIRGISNTSTVQTTSEFTSPPVRSERHVTTEASGNNQQHFSGEEEDNGENPNKTFIKKISGTTKKTIQHAEEGLNKLDSVLKQLRTNMQKK